MRVPGLAVAAGAALVLGMAALSVVAAFQPPTPGSRAYFERLSAANPANRPPHSVPIELRRAHADSCTGYNLELEEAAGIQRRIGQLAEAERLLSMRQACGAVSGIARSAR